MSAKRIDRGNRRWLVALLLSLLCAGVSAQPSPDPQRAFADRDLAPVERWLADLPGERADSAAALRARAWLARRDGDIERALALIDRAIEQEPGSPGLYVDRAAIRSDLLAGAGAFKSMRVARRVRRDLETALESDPEHVGSMVALIAFHRQAPGIVGGEKATAEALMPRLKAVSAAHYQQQRAAESAAEGRFDAAVAAMREALESEADPPLAWTLRLGQWLGESGRAEDAFEIYLQVLARAPGYLPALHALGALSAESGKRLELGIDALSRFLAGPVWPGDPAPADAWEQLARLYEASGRIEAARDARARAEGSIAGRDPRSGNSGR